MGTRKSFPHTSTVLRAAVVLYMTCNVFGGTLNLTQPTAVVHSDSQAHISLPVNLLVYIFWFYFFSAWVSLFSGWFLCFFMR